jgi:hypothetical protein
MSTSANRWVGWVVLAAVCAQGDLSHAWEPPPETLAPGSSSRESFRWLGSPSCSAQACHGDLKPDQAVAGIWGNEHTIWIEGDRHSRAYEALFDPRSKQIAAKLDLGAAHEAQVCLECHAPRNALARVDHLAAAGPLVLGDGVGCEACHGAAEKWLEPHSRRRLSPGERAAMGMRDTEDILERAGLCAGCHVGSPAAGGLSARDVNHELIAAGHPPLRYEYGTFLAKMPKHWTEKRRDPTDAGRIDSGFEARVWAVGQIVAAAAALDLLADRAGVEATAAESDIAPAAELGIALDQPWPEFAEYDCFACHHDLHDKSWRREGYAKRLPDQETLGVPRWGTWYYPLLSSLLLAEPRTADGDVAEPLAPFTELRGLMRSPLTDRGMVAAKARDASRVLGAWAGDLARRSFDRAEVERLLLAVANLPADGDIDHWDGAAQQYLALVALRQAHIDLLGHPSPDDAALAPQLRHLYNELQFTSAGDMHAGRRFDSPHDFNPSKPRDPLRAIRRLLKPGTPLDHQR